MLYYNDKYFFMYKILAIDYGIKRTGLAITDSNRIIASGLSGIMTKNLFSYIESIFFTENIKIIVIGLPLDLNNKKSSLEIYIQKFIKNIINKYPFIKIERIDERFTSKIASRSINITLKKKNYI